MTVTSKLPLLESPTQKIWLETTTLDHGHGGSDFWNFGRALWSPSRDSGGKDIYSLMRQVKSGDLVLHLLKGEGGLLAAFSKASGPYEEIHEPPPLPGEWAGRPSYYRIPVSGFTKIEPPVSIRAALDEHHGAFQAILTAGADRLFYCQYRDTLRLNQGKYLTQVSPDLYALFGGIVHDPEPNNTDPEPKHYREGGVRTYILTGRERDSDLREDAISKYGRSCMVCGFSFDSVYGPDLSFGYIEVHHLTPLASLTEETVTDIEDVIVICSNCHRMIHRRKGETLDWKHLRRAVLKREKSD